MTAYILSGCWHAPGIARAYQIERVLAFFSIPGGAVARWVQYRLSLPYAVSLRGGDVPGTEPGLRLFYRLLKGPSQEHLTSRPIHLGAFSRSETTDRK